MPVTGETTISPKGGEGDTKEEPKPEPKPEPEPIITEVPLPKAHEDLISNLNKWSVKDGTLAQTPSTNLRNHVIEFLQNIYRNEKLNEILPT